MRKGCYLAVLLGMFCLHPAAAESPRGKDVESFRRTSDAIAVPDEVRNAVSNMGATKGAGHTFEDRIKAAGTLTSWMNRFASKGGEMNAALVSALLDGAYALQQGESKGMLHFAGLLTKGPLLSPKATNADKTSLATLRKAHRSYCVALIQFPEIAPRAFDLLATAARDEKDQASLVAAAWVILEQRRTLAVKPDISQFVFSDLAGRSAIAESDRLPSPVQVLVRHLLETDAAKMESRLLPLIRKSDGKEMEQVVRSYGKLWSVEGAGYVEASRDWQVRLGKAAEDKRLRFGPASGDLQVPLHVWTQRKLTVPLDSLFATQPQGWWEVSARQPTKSLSVYATTLMKQADKEPFKRLMQRIRNDVLGEDAAGRAKKIETLIRESVPGPQERPKTPDRVDTYARWVMDLMQEKWGGLLLPMAVEDHFIMKDDWLLGMMATLRNRETWSDPELMLTVMRLTGCLDDAPSFRSWPLIHNGVEHSLFMSIAFGMDGSREAYEVRERLQKIPPTTFGIDLMATFSAQRRTGQEMLNFVKRHPAAFGQLPPHERRSMRVLMKYALDGYPDRVLLGEEVFRILTPLMAEEPDLSELRVDQVIEAKSWAEAKKGDNGLLGKLPEILHLLSIKNRAKAVTCMQHVMRLLGELPTNDGEESTGAPDKVFLQKMGGAPLLFNEVLAMADAAGWSREREWVDGFVQHLVDGPGDDVAEYLVPLFTDTPLSAEAGAFRTIGCPTRLIDGVLGRLLRDLCNNSSGKEGALRAAVVQAMKAKQPQTFGSGLVVAMLDSWPDYDTHSSDVALWVKNHQDDLGKVRDDVAGDLLKILNPGDAGNLDDPPLTAEMLGSLRMIEARHLEYWRTRYMAMASLAPEQRDEAMEMGVRIMHSTAQQDPVLAVDFFRKMSSLLRPEQDSTESAYETHWLEEAWGVPETFAVVAALVAEDEVVKKNGSYQRILSDAARKVDAACQADYKRVKPLLLSTHMLDAAGSFRSWPVGRSGSMYQSILEDTIGFPKRTAMLLEFLDAQKQSTFGLDFMRVIVRDGDRPNWEERKKVAIRWAAEIASAKEPSKSEIQNLLVRNIPQYESLGKESPGLQSIVATKMEQMKAGKAERHTAIVDSIMNAESSKEYFGSIPVVIQAGTVPTIQDMQLGREEAPALAHVMVVDRERASAAFKKFIGLLDEKCRTTQPPSSWMPAMWLQFACTYPDLIPLIRAVATERKLTGNEYWRDGATQRLSFHPPTDEVYASMQRAGLVAEAAEFDPVAWPGPREQESLLHLLVNRDRAVKTMAKYLQAKTVQTFGSDLLVALIMGADSLEMQKFLLKRGPELTSVPADSKPLLLAVFRDVYGQDSSTFPPALKPLLRHESPADVQFRKDVIRGKALADIQVPTDGLVAAGLRVMDALAHDAPEEAERFFNRLVPLLKKDGAVLQGTRGAFRGVVPNDRTRALAFLERLRKKGNDLPTVAFILHVLADYEKGGMLLESQCWDDLLLTDTLEAEWAAVGGRVQPAKAMQQTLKTLSPWMKGTPPMMLAIPFKRFLQRRSAADLKELADWAGKPNEGTEWAPYAVELDSALRLLTPADGEAADRMNVKWEQYRKVAADLQKQGRERLCLHVLADAARQRPADFPSDLLAISLELGLSLWEKDSPPSPEQLSVLISCLTGQKSDPAWQRFAERVWKCWDLPDSKQMRWWLFTEPEKPTLRLAAWGGDDSRIAAIMRHSFFWPVPIFQSFVGITVREGRFATASDYLGKYWSELPLGENDRNGRFGLIDSISDSLGGQEPVSPSSLDQFKKACGQDGDLALLGQFLLSLHDDPPGLLAGASSRRQRLEQVADLLKQAPVTNPGLRSRLIWLLIQAEPDLAAGLQNLLDEMIAARGELPRKDDFDPAELQDAVNLHACAIWAMYLKRDWKAVEDACTKLGGALEFSGTRSYASRRPQRAMLTLALGRLALPKLTVMDVANLQKWAALLEKLVSALPEPSNGFAEELYDHFKLYGLVKTYAEAARADGPVSITRQDGLSIPMRFVKKALASRTDAPSTEMRLRWSKMIYEDFGFSVWWPIGREGYVNANFVESGLLTWDEVIQHAAEVKSLLKHTPSGAVETEIVAVATRQNPQDVVAGVLRWAISASPKPIPQRETLCLQLATLQARAGDYGAARMILKELQDAKLTTHERRERSFLMKLMKE